MDDRLDETTIRTILNRVAAREQSVEDAMAALRVLPFEDLGFAKIDHHRQLRRGFPEVVYCAGKTPEQVADIVARLADRGPRLLGTRATEAHHAAAAARLPGLRYDAVARALWLDR